MEPFSESELVLLSGSGHPDYAVRLSHYLGLPLGETLCGKFADGETRVEIQESVRKRHVVIVQSLCRPQNDNLFELIALIDAAKRADASGITLAMPYMAYGRQDKRIKQRREPVAARLVADMIQSAGATRVIGLDLHSPALQGFFTIPVDDLPGQEIIARHYINHPERSKITVVSPDAGGVARARRVARILGVPLLIISKERSRPNEIAHTDVLGDPTGRLCLMVDDIIDTAGSVSNGTKTLLDMGAIGVEAACTHAVFSKGKDGLSAIERMKAAGLRHVVALDSLPMADDDFVTILPSYTLVGDAIKAIHDGGSVSGLISA